MDLLYAYKTLEASASDDPILFVFKMGFAVLAVLAFAGHYKNSRA